MRDALRLILFAILVALIPLRGMAAIVADLCAPHHGAAMQTSHDCCAEGEVRGSASHGDHGDSAEGSCSHCAACSVGTPALSEFHASLPDAPAGARVIPFHDLRAPGFVPEVLDRPPLPL